MPPGTEPHARHFPYRNRIIAGLAAGTVVVEAAPRSGSLITARLAGEAGREVMAVPGSPLAPRAQGCNGLIRDGATLIQCAADVIEAVRPMLSHVASPTVPFERAEPIEAPPDLRGAIESLLGPSPVPVDELVRQSGGAAGAVQLILLELDLAGRLDRHAGGIDIFYPPENQERQKALYERGLVIAEMPPGTEPRARHFPYRNRIIAGMSSGTVVVEAAPRSGSLITARLAAEAGREVMAVPGSPLDPRAQGCNQLIRDGATLIQNAADVVEAIRPFESRVRSAPESYAGPAEEVNGHDALSLVEELLGPSPVPVDEIMRLSGAPSGAVQMALLELDLAGRLDRHAGNRVSLRPA
jgi:predicted Rossmann fold nucleotide-binding protein DprA/Smf involved in DNA uptake